jgi:acetoin utilization deacetylase AcuC-like enzyme
MATLIAFVPASEHALGGHPESPERMAAIGRLLLEEGVLPDLLQIKPQIASREQLLRVHRRSLVDTVRQAALLGRGRLDADTYVTGASYEQARLAAGTVSAAAQHVATGKTHNGLALVRPPGHHAEAGRVGGFCLFNNVAVAARHVQAALGLERILIIDFDVHHGNGTQEIFYGDPSVMFISLHLYHDYFYPGTGAAGETGSGNGAGANINVPFGPLAGDTSYLKAIDNLVWPAAKRFRPELILVSAGYDAHWVDPLAAGNLSLAGLARVTAEIVQMAEEMCDGKVVFALEGGYHSVALSYGVLNTVYALMGWEVVADPLGPSPQPEPDMTALILQLERLHLP